MNRPEVKPFSPTEVLAARRQPVSNEVIEAVNELLVQLYSANTTAVYLDKSDVVELSLDKKPRGWKAEDISDELDELAALYETRGWTVTRNLPSDGSPFFKFEPSAGISTLTVEELCALQSQEPTKAEIKAFMKLHPGETFESARENLREKLYDGKPPKGFKDWQAYWSVVHGLCA